MDHAKDELLDEICTKVAHEEFSGTGGLNEDGLYEEWAKAVAKEYAYKLEEKRLAIDTTLNLLSVQIEEPHWNKADRTHDWRNHVPDNIKEEWDILGIQAKLVVYQVASIQADREEWD